jgi:hypothetical protein
VKKGQDRGCPLLVASGREVGEEGIQWPLLRPGTSARWQQGPGWEEQVGFHVREGPSEQGVLRVGCRQAEVPPSH